jgi:hypothetical protein
MENDLWRQWQAFVDLMNPAGNNARPAAAVPPGFAPFAQAAERFTAAAQTFLDSTAKASTPAAAEAARAFSDFLREQFADYHPPWGAAFGVAPGAAPAFSADSPALGPNREHQQRWQRAAEAWQRMIDAQRRLQRLWSDALHEAAASFAARSPDSGKRPLSVQTRFASSTTPGSIVRRRPTHARRTARHFVMP